MDEGHKRVLLIAASILAARKFAELESKPSPALEAAMSDAITMAERLMQRIDARFRPPPPDQSMNSSNSYPWKNER